MAEQQVMRSAARSVANFMDEAKDLKQQFRRLEKEAKQQNIRPHQLPEFNALYNRSLARDKQAFVLLTSQHESIEKMQKSSKLLETIEYYGERHERYQAIESIAKLCDAENLSSLLVKHISKIDLSKDYTHIVSLALQHNMTAETLGKKI